MTPWTAASQAPLFMGFSRQGYWSGLPFPICVYMVLNESESERVAQSCPTLCNPVDCSPPSSSVHGILQARVLEWGAIAFSMASNIFCLISSYSPLFGVKFAICYLRTFPGSSDGKASTYNAGDSGSTPGSGRSPGEGNGTPLQYSCLENPMD